MAKVAVVMGSESDFDVVKKTVEKLKAFGVESVVRVISAHRTPDEAHNFVLNAENEGIEVIIAAAGKAAHLGGVLAAYTVIPVIGLPIKSSTMDGLDSLLSIVQMPAGIPVATVAINGAENAALLAVQMLALKDQGLKEKLIENKRAMAQAVMRSDERLRAKIEKGDF